jgi:F-type H+-transporting ATPase subunit delta
MKLTKEVRRISRELFRGSFTGGKLDEARVRVFARFIAEKKPRHHIDLLKNYHRLIRLESEKQTAVIESAVPLDSGAQAQVVAGLKARYGADLTADFKINPALIGGMRVKIGSDVWDGSVQSRLVRLEEEFSHA